MPTATLHIDNLVGYAGHTRCYRIDPPRAFGDEIEHEYVAISVSPPTEWTDAEVVLIAATETGASAYPSIRRRIGSFTPDGDPFESPDHLEGCFVWALSSIGGYTAEGS